MAGVPRPALPGPPFPPWRSAPARTGKTSTVSIGVARYRQGESQESWIERADRAMYQAKQAGRNRIVLE